MKNRRRTLFCAPLRAMDYLKLVLVAMLAPAFLATACLYYLIWQTVAQQLAIPETHRRGFVPRLTASEPSNPDWTTARFRVDLFLRPSAFPPPAGPIYRIEKDLEIMADTGNFDKPIHIRPGDHLHSLVAKINRALERAREH